MNWMRRHVPPIERAIALASDVLPTPGTSSMSRWPSANRHTSERWIARRLPRRTVSIWRASASKRSLKDVSGRGAACTVSTSVPGELGVATSEPNATVRSDGAELRDRSRTARPADPAPRVGVRGRRARGSAAPVVDGGAPMVPVRAARLVAAATASPGAAASVPRVPARDRVRTGRAPSAADIVEYLEWCTAKGPDARVTADARPSKSHEPCAARRYTLPTDEEVTDHRGSVAPAQRQLRTAVCRVVSPRGRARAQGQGRDRPPQRRRVPLRAPDRSGADGDPARALRAGAVPRHRAAVAPGRVRARPPPLPVLRQRRREPRPRRAAVARRPAHVGERRRVVPGCNARKEDRLLSECGMVLRRAPVAPHATTSLIVSAGPIDPLWHQYLARSEAVPA